jgi:hypothetical protein
MLVLVSGALAFVVAADAAKVTAVRNVAMIRFIYSTLVISFIIRIT